MNHTIKKSYFLVDTPVSCMLCDLSLNCPSDDYMSRTCPLLGTTFSTNTDNNWKDENCPLKSIELNIKLEV